MILLNISEIFSAYDGTIRRSAAFKCRKNSNPSLAISFDYKRSDSTDSLPTSQPRKGSGTSMECKKHIQIRRLSLGVQLLITVCFYLSQRTL